MAKANTIIDGLLIFREKAGDRDLHVEAQHDCLYVAYSGMEDLDEETRKKLEGLRWFYDKTTQCWQHFT